jgi:Tfp pilus assembly protein PilN
VRAVNLLPREAPRQHKRPALVVQLAVASPFVVGSLLAAGYLLANSKVEDKKATLAVLKADLEAIPQPAQASPVDGALAAQHSQRILALAAALRGRVAWDSILRDVSSVLPEDAWLTTLSAQSPQAPAPAPAATTTTDTTATTTTSGETSGGETTTESTPRPAPPPVAPLVIKGYTYSQEGVARLLSRLAVIPALQDVKLIQSVQTVVVGRNVYSFQIQASVRPQATA